MEKCFVKGCKEKPEHLCYDLLRRISYCKKHEKLADKVKLDKKAKDALRAINGVTQL